MGSCAYSLYWVRVQQIVLGSVAYSLFRIRLQTVSIVLSFMQDNFINYTCVHIFYPYFKTGNQTT